MSTKIILVLCAVMAISSCNVVPQPRIVGGNDAQQNQALYVASLQTKAYGHFCGGAILNNRWVLTAASCMLNVGAFYVRVGTHTYNQGGADYDIDALLLHYRFYAETRSNDIALIRTAKKIVVNANIAFISISNRHIGVSNGVVAGWGHTKVNGNRSNRLQVLETPIITNQVCKSQLAFNNYSNLILESNICTNAKAGRGICRADSGSPLVIGKELVGIASFAVGCATGAPDVYTRVSTYESWIRTTQAQNP